MSMWTLLTPGPAFLTEDEQRGLAVLFRQLVPSDPAHGVPGAEQAGAVDFLAALLSRDEQTYYEIPAWRTLYREGLAFLDAAAQERFSRPLVELDEAQAIGLLEALERGELKGEAKGEANGQANGQVDQALLFKTLRRHCIQGCFCDPRWGGNRDQVMWRWYGYLQDAEDVR